MVSAGSSPPGWTEVKMEIVEKKKLRVLLVLLLGVLFVCAGPASAQTDWTYTDCLPAQAGSYILTADVTLTDTWAVPAGSVTLDLNGKSITISGQEKTKPVIKISAGTQLTLEENTSKTGKISGGSEGIFVAGGTFIMNMDDSEISENTSGVKIEDGTFEMKSGGITWCTDGVVQSGGTFNMEDGFIVYSSDAGVVQSGGTFEMSGGFIQKNSHGVVQPPESKGSIEIIYSNYLLIIADNYITGLTVSNKAELSGGLIDNNPSGVVITSGTFTMSGGAITGGTVGVDQSGGIFEMTNGQITGSGPVAVGVVQSGGYFKMRSGQITGNTRGVYQPDNSTGEISISRTAVIAGNTDAGMIVSNIAKLIGGCIDKNPSGVVINSGTFTMSGGTITGGTDGVVQSGGEFKMTGGEITGNTRGVSQPDNSTGEISISGTAVITDNKASGLTVSNIAVMEDGSIDKNPSGVVISSGTFTMSDGTITGGTDGVVQSGGTFTMSGGKIERNDDDGVVQSGGTFTMSSGFIENNAGDGVEISGGEFTMSGGEITSNDYGVVQPPNSTGEIHISGTASINNNTRSGLIVNNTAVMEDGTIQSNNTGAAVNSGTFTMTNGIITKNTEYGVLGAGGIFNMSGGTITEHPYGVYQYDNSGSTVSISGTASIADNTSAGVYVKETVNMSGGTISGSPTGVEVIRGTFNMSGSGRITGNKTGDGVEITGGEMNMSGGTISNRRFGVNVSNGSFNLGGGNISDNYEGVYISGQAGKVTMTGGTIESNEGHCAVVNSNGTFEMSGGSITGNHSGLSLNSGNCNLSGSPVITGNGISGSAGNILFYAESQKINIIDPLTVNAKIGVRLDPHISIPCVFTSGLKEKGDASHFSSDDPAYRIGLTADGEAVIGAPVEVTFDTGQIGTPPAAQTTAQGALVKKPDFSADGYTLLGWYQDLSSDVPWDFDRDTVTAVPVTLYAKFERQEPDVSFNADGADSGTLTNLKPGMAYILDGGGSWTVVSGTSVRLTGLKAGDSLWVRHDAAYNPLVPESAVKKITIAQAAVPAGLRAEQCTTEANNDGKISGLDSNTRYEYRPAAESVYTEVPTGAAEISGLAAGDYRIRVKAAGAVLASADLELTVPEYTAPAPPADPDFSIPEGTYSGPQTVKITTATDGAEIYYTTDGTVPSVNSTKYDPNTGITVTQTVTIMAIVVKDGVSSAVITMIYTIDASAVPMDLQMDINNFTNTGAKGVPGDIEDTSFTISVLIREGDKVVSLAENVKLGIYSGLIKITSEIHFDRKIEDLSSEKYGVVIEGLPKSVYGAPPLKQRYILSAEAWISKEGGIMVYLKWDDGKVSVPEVIKVYPLPEDEVGAYVILDDGTKEYLIFHTYSICMHYLGRDDLCRGYERCFHKEHPYVNPFVRP